MQSSSGSASAVPSPRRSAGWVSPRTSRRRLRSCAATRRHSSPARRCTSTAGPGSVRPRQVRYVQSATHRGGVPEIDPLGFKLESNQLKSTNSLDVWSFPTMRFVRNRSFRLLIAPLAAGTLVLAGCGGGDDAEGNDDSTDAGAPPSNSQTIGRSDTWPLTGLPVGRIVTPPTATGLARCARTICSMRLVSDATVVSSTSGSSVPAGSVTSRNARQRIPRRRRYRPAALAWSPGSGCAPT